MGGGKSTVIVTIAARRYSASLDIYYLDCEYASRNDICAGGCHGSNDEINLLENRPNV
jgi:hypothetical protein